MVTVPQNNVQQTLIYKTVGKREVELLFYPPTNTVYEKAPLLVLIPGGGWSMSVAESMYRMARPLAESLRAAGFAAAALSYRNHRDDGVMMSAIADDVFDAAAFLALHADTLGIDPRRMYTCGHSAGGHLALLLAFAPCDFGQERVYQTPFAVRGCVPLSPPTVMSHTKADIARYGLDMHFLFKNAGEEFFSHYSPLWWAQNGCGVPTLTAAGDRDKLVPAVHSEDLCRALAAHSIPARLLLSTGGGHCLEPIDTDAASLTLAEALAQMTDFILNENAE